MLESGANITKQIFYLMKKNKKIFFLTVGRSDFLRQKSIFDNITKEKNIDSGLIISGSHHLGEFGKTIKEVSIDQGKMGKSFRTTLDLELQKLSSELLKGKAGSVCVMDIYRGDIIAVSYTHLTLPTKA